MTYTIRPIEARDNEAVAKIVRDCLVEYDHAEPGSAYTDPFLDRLSEVYQEPATAYWVAIDEDDIVVAGCGIGAVEGEPEICELQKMYSLPRVRGTGCAQMLVDTALAFAKEHYAYCYLETFANMGPAQSMYRRNGFEPTDTRHGATGHTACDKLYIKEL